VMESKRNLLKSKSCFLFFSMMGMAKGYCMSRATCIRLDDSMTR
jgi:hypothetical protein